MGGSILWWRYSNAAATSRAMCSLLIKLSLLAVRLFFNVFECSHSSRLPLQINSRTSALNSPPLWSKPLHTVITFTRFRCRILLRALHSVKKLLLAPRRLRLRTFIATVAKLSSTTKVPMYTLPKLPEPIKLPGENDCVAERSSS